MINKKIVTLFFLVGLVLGVTIVLALYQLTIPMNFKLSVSYGLEIWNEAETEQLASIDYPDFEDGQVQIVKCYLRNTGNSIINVTWDGTIPAEWQFQIDTPSGWVKGSMVRTIGIGEQLLLQCQLTELSATVGTSYSTDLTFSILGS